MGSIFWAESVGSINRAHVWTEFSEQELRAERGLGQLQAQSRTGAPQVFAPSYRSNDLRPLGQSKCSVLEYEICAFKIVLVNSYGRGHRISVRGIVFVKYGATFCARMTNESFFPRKIYAREIFKRFALEVVICEQTGVTFEVTDASFVFATC
ncbi:hypothetical protein QL285_079955 [Trifolium repens]|nr:hypothetical protein QL285_079955 [Trifolium repens]